MDGYVPLEQAMSCSYSNRCYITQSHHTVT